MNIAKITVELPDGSVTRHFDADTFIDNRDLHGVVVEDMVDVIINSKDNKF